MAYDQTKATESTDTFVADSPLGNEGGSPEPQTFEEFHAQRQAERDANREAIPGEAPSEVPDDEVSTPEEENLETNQDAPLDDPNAAAKDAIHELSEMYGVDLSGFTNEADARQAVRILAEQYAQTGLQSEGPGFLSPGQQLPATPVPQPPVNTPKPGPETDSAFDWDDADLDPKVAAGLRYLRDQAEEAKRQANEAYSALEQQKNQAREQQLQEIYHRANSVIDGLSSPKYGVGQNRNFQQQMATQNVMRLADAVIHGMQSRGVPVPTIDKVMQMALELDGGVPAKPGQGKPAGGKPPERHPVSGSPKLAPKRRPNSASGGNPLMQDDEFLNGARAILRR